MNFDAPIIDHSENIIPTLVLISFFFPLLIFSFSGFLYEKSLEKRKKYPLYNKLISLPVLSISLFFALSFFPVIFYFISQIPFAELKQKPEIIFIILLCLVSIVCAINFISIPFPAWKEGQLSKEDLRFFFAWILTLLLGALFYFSGEFPRPILFPINILTYFAIVAGILFVASLFSTIAHASQMEKQEEEQKQEQAKEAEKQTRAAFYSSLSTFLDPYQAALVKFPLGYYEDGNPLKEKIRTDIETIKDFTFKLASSEAKQYLSDELAKGNARTPDAILLTRFSIASLAAQNAQSLPLSEMQAFLFALWHDLLSVSKPEDLTPEKIASYNAVPHLTAQRFHTLKTVYGEGVAERLQNTRPEGGLRAYLDDFSRALDREVVPHLARRGFQVLGYCRDDRQPHTYQENRAEDAAIPPDSRFEHLYVTGKTGAGKTTLLQNLISQDLNRGEGVIVLSPENDLFENLLHCIPRHRTDDLIYFDPSDTTPPIVGFNPFHFEPGEDFTQKAGEVATIFSRAMGAELGVNMKTLFENSVRALIQYPEATIEDFDALLDAKNDTFRARLIASPHVDERTKNFFKTKFKDDKFYRASADRVLSRLDAFFRPPLLDILSNHSIAYSDVLNASQRILFFNLSKLRGVNASICGQLLIAQLQQTFMQRDAIPEASRLPYHLYMDEFQVYASEAEETIKELFNRVRKYKVSITLSNQNMDDIPASLLSSIIANVGSLACFLLPADKAVFFAKELQLKDWDGKIDAVSLQNLNTGEIFFRQPKKKRGFSVRVPSQPILTPNDPETEKDTYPAALKATSKHRYGKTPAPASPPTPPRQNPRESENEGAEFDIE